MEKKFIKVSHEDIEEIHRGILGVESMVVVESEVDFVNDLIKEGDYLTAGLSLCDLGYFHIARDTIEKLKMKQESEDEKDEKKGEKKITDKIEDFINGVKAV